MILMMVVMAFPVIGLVLFFFLPWRTALLVYLVGSAVAIFYHRAMMGSQRRRVATGRKGMLGQTATVFSWQSDRGTVRCHGELWKARMEDGGPAVPGAEAVVVELDGLTLVLRRSDPSEPGSHAVRAMPLRRA